jgi:hypothetical protein
LSHVLRYYIQRVFRKKHAGHLPLTFNDATVETRFSHCQ